MPPNPLPSEAKVQLDQIQRSRLQTLLAVDELVADIVKRLEAMQVLDDTYVIYTSDNGYHIGQFCQFWDKRQPYDTDIQVPLFIRGPGIPIKHVVSYPVANIDLAPTIVEMAGLKLPVPVDGESVLGLLNKTVFEKSMLIEYYGEENSMSVADKCPWKYDSHLAVRYILIQPNLN